MSDFNDFAFKDSLGYWISIAGLVYKGELGKCLKPFNVTPEQWVILNRLSYDDGVCQKELADRLTKDQSNTARILEKMVNKGLVRRDPNPSDGRSFLVSLTAKGKKLREQLLPVVMQFRKKAQTGFSELELKFAKELLQKFLTNLG